MPNMRKVICALDTADLSEAEATVRRLALRIKAFKIGHALTLSHGISVVGRLRDAGAERIFLDLKFHDIPNVIALAVREAAKYGVWMTTLHISGGPSMMEAAVEEAHSFPEESRPLLVGVSVLTSLDGPTLHQLGVLRPLPEHVLQLSLLAEDHGLDGVVCSAHEVRILREHLRHGTVLVTPGIRPADGQGHDQRRIGTAAQALGDGADYLVIGRALTGSDDLETAIRRLGLAAEGGEPTLTTA